MRRIISWGSWLLLAAASIAGFVSRTPLLAPSRGILFAGALCGLTAVIALGIVRRRSAPRQAWSSAGLAALVLGCTVEHRIDFWLDERRVLSASPSELARFGPHLVIGVRDLGEAVRLAERGAIGGIYLQRGFVAGKSLGALQAEIAQIRRAVRLPAGRPFLVMADQEGGIVSHLSPPLSSRPELGALLDGLAGAELERAAREAGRTVGEELVSLGVNLNLAPVVDLRTQVEVKLDAYSRISRRAISPDPAVVAAAARAYCAGLSEKGVGCTLKHFPGLGRLAADAHLELGDLPVAVSTLEANDWLPFAGPALGARTAVMVSHVRVPELDSERPASISPALVQGALRDALGFEGLVITDNLSMLPISLRRGGVRKAGCEALAAGVDLLLVSYDPDLYYEAMAGLLDRCGGAEIEERLAASDRRLGGWASR